MSTNTNPIYEADIHAFRLTQALSHLGSILPLTKITYTNFTEQQFSASESFTLRLTKLYNVISHKILRLFMRKQGINLTYKKTSDLLELSEQFLLIPSKDEWLELKTARDRLAEDHPFDIQVTVENFNNAVTAVAKLLTLWENIKKRLEETNENTLTSSDRLHGHSPFNSE